jgi:hypothetical protein
VSYTIRRELNQRVRGSTDDHVSFRVTNHGGAQARVQFLPHYRSGSKLVHGVYKRVCVKPGQVKEGMRDGLKANPFEGPCITRIDVDRTGFEHNVHGLCW